MLHHDQCARSWGRGVSQGACFKVISTLNSIGALRRDIVNCATSMATVYNACLLYSHGRKGACDIHILVVKDGFSLSCTSGSAFGLRQQPRNGELVLPGDFTSVAVR